MAQDLTMYYSRAKHSYILTRTHNSFTQTRMLRNEGGRGVVWGCSRINNGKTGKGNIREGSTLFVIEQYLVTA